MKPDERCDAARDTHFPYNEPSPAPLAKGPLAKGKPSATELLYELSAAAQRLAKRY